jgi:hypothetical protein
MRRSDWGLAGGLLLLALSVFVLAGAILAQHLPEADWETVWIAVTGLFTVMLAVSTIMLWSATKSMGERSDRAFRTAERAYVKMSHAPPGLRCIRALTDDMSTQYLITLTITNFGRTPAKVTDVLVNRVMVPANLPPDQKLPAKPDYKPDPWYPESPKAFLVTNDTFSFTRVWQFWDKIESPEPTHELYAIGYVDYEDAFGTRYRAGYARLYAPAANKEDFRIYPTPESYAGRSNLVFVTQEGYNYDICLDEEGS